MRDDPDRRSAEARRRHVAMLRERYLAGTLDELFGGDDVRYDRLIDALRGTPRRTRR